METLDEIKEKIKSSTDNEYILESLKANEKLQDDREVMLAAVKLMDKHYIMVLNP